MILQELIDHYQNSYRFHLHTKMSHNCWQNWAEKKYIPIHSQMRLEKITNGLFIADLKHTDEGK